MKKRSAASSKKEPPEPLGLFVDRSLGKKIVSGALRLAGAHVEIHDDHFAPDAYRAPALAAIRAAAVRMFVLTAGDLQGREMAAIFVAALPRIARLASGQPAPFIANVTKRGAVSVLASARQLR